MLSKDRGNKQGAFKMTITEEQLFDALPHGSGINCDWEIVECKVGFMAYNSFHCMNEHGMYDGYADFYIVVSKNLETLNPGTWLERQCVDFKLRFQGKLAQAKNTKYMLREYLEDTLAYSLDNNLVEKGE